MQRLLKILTIISLILSIHHVFGQVNAIVELSKKSVYVQQPFRVNITVYTKTWFTAPIEFGNLQIPNAFIVPFDKTQPGMFTVGGKLYPGIQFYYIVFPYKVGHFNIPALEITAQSPPEGSASSQKVLIHTPVQSFTVKDIPENFQNEAWLVAKDVIVSEKWNTDFEHLKVGDVLERTIMIDAKGTLPQFIPEITNQLEVKFASIYPKDAVLNNEKEDGDVSGKRTQTVTYLLEKAGSFTLPEIRLSFWNPYTSKMQERVLKAKTIQIAENPDLGILTTLRDSLQAATPSAKEQTKKTFLIFGIAWYKIVGFAIPCLILLYAVLRFAVRLYRKIRAKRRISKQLKKEAIEFKKKGLLNDLQFESDLL